jgi:hypothetical protein
LKCDDAGLWFSRVLSNFAQLRPVTRHARKVCVADFQRGIVDTSIVALAERPDVRLYGDASSARIPEP